MPPMLSSRPLAAPSLAAPSRARIVGFQFWTKKDVVHSRKKAAQIRTVGPLRPHASRAAGRRRCG